MHRDRDDYNNNISRKEQLIATVDFTLESRVLHPSVRSRPPKMHCHFSKHLDVFF